VIVFVDTSAFLSVLDRSDTRHKLAGATWLRLLNQKDTTLVCTSYVLLESITLIQRRLGMTYVQTFQASITPVLQVAWVDPALHGMGMEMMLAANHRRLSLVDCVSFAIMRQRGVSHYFAFDEHFAEQGFAGVASP
jgi:uncharacterized protein